MIDDPMFDEVDRAKSDFGVKCDKFTGAVATEVVRRYLRRNGIPVSRRDVFIKGVAREIDLVIPKPRRRARCYDLVYEPQDVVAVLEIKSNGAFGDGALDSTKANFKKISRSACRVLCCYLTIVEKRNYKCAVTTQRLGFPAYTLYWATDDGLMPTKDWEKLLRRLRAALGKAR